MTAPDRNKFPSAMLTETPMPARCREFLLQTGLPKSAPPFLSFIIPHDDKTRKPCDRLPSVEDFFDIDSPDLAPYVVLGTDGDDSPIAMHSESGAIILVDHTNEYEIIEFSSSIEALDESLTAYAQFVARAMQEHGDEGYINARFTPQDVEKLQEELQKVDPSNLDEGRFWYYEIECLLEQIDSSATH